MALVGKARRCRSFRRRRPCGQQITRPAHPRLHQIGVRRQPHGCGKGTGEMERAQAGHPGQVRQPHVVGAVGVQIVAGAAHGHGFPTGTRRTGGGRALCRMTGYPAGKYGGKPYFLRQCGHAWPGAFHVAVQGVDGHRQFRVVQDAAGEIGQRAMRQPRLFTGHAHDVRVEVEHPVGPTRIASVTRTTAVVRFSGGHQVHRAPGGHVVAPQIAETQGPPSMTPSAYPS